MTNFNGQTAVITGGAQGFGFAIANRIIESGGKVIIWDIDKSEIDKAQKEINSSHTATFRNQKRFNCCLPNLMANLRINFCWNY